MRPSFLAAVDALLALVERVGLVAGDERDRLHAAIVHQVLVDDRPGLVAGDHAQDRIARRRRVERLRERIGEVEGAVLLGDRAHAGGGRVDVRADDVLDPVLLRQALGAGHGQLGIVLVVDRDDLDLVLLAADVDAALGVVHVGGRFGAVLVGQAPGRRRAAHHAEHADLQHLLGSGRVRRQAPGPRRPAPCPAARCDGSAQIIAIGQPPIWSRTRLGAAMAASGAIGRGTSCTSRARMQADFVYDTFPRLPERSWRLAPWYTCVQALELGQTLIGSVAQSMCSDGVYNMRPL